MIFLFFTRLSGTAILIPYEKRLRVLVALGMVLHDKVLLLAVVIYLRVSFFRFLDFC